MIGLSFMLVFVLVATSVQGQVNVALNKATVQDSTGWEGDSGRGVDGETSGDYWVNSCTHTNKVVNPWWSVDLGAEEDIERVILYNRQDCCAERLRQVIVYVTDVAPSAGSPPDANAAGSVTCGSFPGSGTPGQVIEIPCASLIRGQYVVVQITAAEPEYLTLCEVEVLSPINAAAGQPTVQHSTGWEGDSNRGVDGNASPDYWVNSCTHTNKVVKPWWAVDLGSDQEIRQVKVINRADCCAERLHDLIAYTTDSMPSAGDESPAVVSECGEYAGPAGAGEVVLIDCPAGTSGQFLVIQIQADAEEYLTMCEVAVYTAGPNLALNQPTTQQSLDFAGDSAYGVDGDTNNDYFEYSCTHTAAVDNPWWSVDLGSETSIGRVVLYNREDCCAERLSNVRVYTASSMPQAGGSPDEVALCGTYDGPAGAGEVVEIVCEGGLAGQYVVVQLEASNRYLTLCEVAVYP